MPVMLSLIETGDHVMILRAIVYTACMSGVASICADDEYVFVENLDRIVAINRGKWTIVGRLDRDGNLVPMSDGTFEVLRKNQPASGIGFEAIINARIARKEPVFEFSAGKLIKGVLDEEGVFIPEANSKVIEFKDYRYSKDTPRIYNLPGRFEKKRGSK
jgi:hypothetical protein